GERGERGGGVGDTRPRPLAKAQPELQHIERCFRMAPLGEFITPGCRKLRPAQTFRLFRRKRLRQSSVWPFKLSSRRHPQRSLMVSMHGKHAGNALDHDLARITLGFPKKSDTRPWIATTSG